MSLLWGEVKEMEGLQVERVSVAFSAGLAPKGRRERISRESTSSREEWVDGLVGVQRQGGSLR